VEKKSSEAARVREKRGTSGKKKVQINFRNLKSMKSHTPGHKAKWGPLWAKGGSHQIGGGGGGGGGGGVGGGGGGGGTRSDGTTNVRKGKKEFVKLKGWQKEKREKAWRVGIILPTEIGPGAKPKG